MIEKKEGFGERLEICMKARKISNSELTQKLKVNKNAIGNYKNGQVPNASILYELSNILGTTMEYLIAGKDAADLTPEEQQLVDLYRRADDRGKRSIMRTAASESAELESSTSRIG